jgi:hypothetical protein
VQSFNATECFESPKATDKGRPGRRYRATNVLCAGGYPDPGFRATRAVPFPAANSAKFE